MHICAFCAAPGRAEEVVSISHNPDFRLGKSKACACAQTARAARTASHETCFATVASLSANRKRIAKIAKQKTKRKSKTGTGAVRLPMSHSNFLCDLCAPLR